MSYYHGSGDAAPPRGGKRAPIVFGVDVTKSMLWTVNGDKTRIQLANEMIATFCKHILSIPKAADAVEIAFVLFAHDIMLETEFVNVTQISMDMFDHAKKADECGSYELHEIQAEVRPKNMPPFRRTGRVPEFTVAQDKGSRIDSAIIHCYNKIEELKQFYTRNGVPFYAPHFVLVTDGDPDDRNNPNRERDDAATHQKAIDMIYDHTSTHHEEHNLIVPIIMGIFGKESDDDARKRVADYTEKEFPDGYYRIEDGRDAAAAEFTRAVEFLCKTVVESLTLNDYTSRESDRNLREFYRR